MSLMLVAHGTRKQRGVAMIGDLAEQVSESLGQKVHVSFVDVLGPILFVVVVVGGDVGLSVGVSAYASPALMPPARATVLTPATMIFVRSFMRAPTLGLWSRIALRCLVLGT